MSRQALLTLSAVAALCVFATLSIQARGAGQETMVVVRDPHTGKLRKPTPDEMAALRAAAPPPNASLTSAQSAQPSVMTRPNGARGVRVGESHLVYEVIIRDADGKLVRQCVHGEDAVPQAHSHPAHPAAADQESDHESR